MLIFFCIVAAHTSFGIIGNSELIPQSSTLVSKFAHSLVGSPWSNSYHYSIYQLWAKLTHVGGWKWNSLKEKFIYFSIRSIYLIPEKLCQISKHVCRIICAGHPYGNFILKIPTARLISSLLLNIDVLHLLPILLSNCTLPII